MSEAKLVISVQEDYIKGIQTFLSKTTSAFDSVSSASRKFENSVEGADAQVRKLVASGQNISDRLTPAFDELGIKSGQSMEEAKNKINKAYKSILQSGLATSNELKRAERARAAAIEKIDTDSFAKRGRALEGFRSKYTQVIGGLVSVYALKSLVDTIGTLEEGWIGVAKTTGLAGEEFENLKGRIQDLSLTMKGVSIEELQSIAETAGQLGITGVENIEEFTRVVAMMAVATNLTAESAAEDFAQLSNILHEPIEGLETLGSVINELSNTTTATASDLTNLAKRIGGAAETIGLTTPQVLGLSATLKDMGVNIEVGGTAMSQVLIKMLTDTEKFAKVAGVDFEEFAQTVKDEPLEALKLLIAQIAKMDATEAAMSLGELGLEGQKATGMMLKLAGGMDVLEKNLMTANEEYEKGTSLQKEYAVASESLFAESTSVGNALKLLADDMGTTLLPMMKTLLAWVRDSILWFKAFAEGIGEGAAKIALFLQGYDVSELEENMKTPLEKVERQIDSVSLSLEKLKGKHGVDAQVTAQQKVLNGLYEKRTVLLEKETDGIKEKAKEEEAAAKSFEDRQKEALKLQKTQNKITEDGTDALKDYADAVQGVGLTKIASEAKKFSNSLKDNKDDVSEMSKALKSYLGTVQDVYGEQIAGLEAISEAMKKSGSDTESIAKVNEDILEVELASAQNRLSAWEAYYGNLEKLRDSNLKAQEKAVNDLSKMEAGAMKQREKSEERIASLRGEMSEEGKDVVADFFNTQQRLDEQLAMAYEKTGQDKIKALDAWQESATRAAKSLEADADGIINKDFEIENTIWKIQEAQAAVVEEQDKLAEAKQREIEQMDIIREKTEEAMELAKKKIEEYQAQVVDLGTKLESLQMKIDNVEAVAAIDRVKQYLDSIPNVITKTMEINVVQSGSPMSSQVLASPVASSGISGLDDLITPVDSFARGTTESGVPRDGLYELHRGEVVQTRAKSQGKVAGGGVTLQMGGITISGTNKSPEQLAKDIVRPMRKELKKLGTLIK